MMHFNSHARVGRDTGASSRQLPMVYFNSHARVGRDDSRNFGSYALPNFNSHARVGRDQAALAQGCLSSAISTHTPAWGVTLV